jgi:SAM-dependent methyltransferase
MTDHGDHVGRNRSWWEEQAPRYAEVAPGNWDEAEPSWGIFGVPDAEARLLPDVAGLDVVELGCGTAYVSSWLARRGARLVVGLDPTTAQLATARAMQDRAALVFPLVQGDAELLPFADASFDVAVSEYGAAIWCDPYVWMPEAARLLRPGGRLEFLGHSPLVMICTPEGAATPEEEPVDDQLHRDQFGMHRFDWPDSTEFALPHGEMIRLLHDCGFEIEDLIEIQAPEGGKTGAQWIDLAWARRWPCEDIWKARKR